MDEGLILSASTGEPREFCYEMTGDYYRFLMDVSVVSQRQAPTIQKERKTLEVPQIMTQETVVLVARPYPKCLDVPYVNPIVQTMQKTVEDPQMQYIGKIDDVSVVMQCQIPTVQAVQKAVEVPQVQFHDRVAGDPVVMQVPVTQEHILECIVEKIDVPVPRVVEETVEVETLKSQRSEGESTLPASRELASKQDCGCAVQAPEWEELQRVRDEELVTIHDTNKLPNDGDNLELFKETLPSPSLMQLQSDKRGVAHRARAVVGNSSGSSRVNLISLAINSKRVGKVISMTEEVVSLFQQEQDDDGNKKTSCLIDIGRAEDADTSLAIDTKGHESVITDPTEQQQHWHSNQRQPTR